MAPVPIVLAAEVLVDACSRVNAGVIQFPAMPPKTLHAASDAVGAFVNADGDFALVLSDEIVEQMFTALTDPRGLAWDVAQADQAANVIARIAEASGGGFVTAPAAATVP